MAVQPPTRANKSHDSQNPFHIMEKDQRAARMHVHEQAEKQGGCNGSCGACPFGGACNGNGSVEPKAELKQAELGDSRIILETPATATTSITNNAPVETQTTFTEMPNQAMSFAASTSTSGAVTASCYSSAGIAAGRFACERAQDYRSEEHTDAAGRAEYETTAPAQASTNTGEKDRGESPVEQDARQNSTGEGGIAVFSPNGIAQATQQASGATKFKVNHGMQDTPVIQHQEEMTGTRQKSDKTLIASETKAGKNRIERGHNPKAESVTATNAGIELAAKGIVENFQLPKNHDNELARVQYADVIQEHGQRYSSRDAATGTWPWITETAAVSNSQTTMQAEQIPLNQHMRHRTETARHGQNAKAHVVGNYTYEEILASAWLRKLYGHLIGMTDIETPIMRSGRKTKSIIDAAKAAGLKLESAKMARLKRDEAKEATLNPRTTRKPSIGYVKTEIKIPDRKRVSGKSLQEGARRNKESDTQASTPPAGLSEKEVKVNHKPEKNAREQNIRKMDKRKALRQRTLLRKNAKRKNSFSIIKLLIGKRKKSKRKR